MEDQFSCLFARLEELERSGVASPDSYRYVFNALSYMYSLFSQIERGIDVVEF